MARRWKSNAVKHGAFSVMIFLPGEDREEFKALYDALEEEWDPQGPTQKDKVFNIANNMWRKRRSQWFLREAAEVGDFLNRREERDIEAIADCLEGEKAGKPLSELKLPRRLIAVINTDVPRKNFASNEAWHKKVVETLNELYWELSAEHGKNTEKLVVKRFSDEKVIAEQLALEERIDAKIDRDIKALGQMKTMQAMGLGRRQSGPVIEHEPTKEPLIEHEPTKEIESPRFQAMEPPPGQTVESPPVQTDLAGCELPKEDTET